MATSAPNKRPAPIDIQQQIAEARRRAEQVKAQIEANRAKTHLVHGSIPPGVPVPSKNEPSLPKTAAEEARARVEALKARVAAAKARAKGDEIPQRFPTQPQSYDPSLPESEDPSRAGGVGRGGLSIGIHPALLDNAPDRSTSFSKLKSKTKNKEEEKINPYLSEAGLGGRARRVLNFTHNEQQRPALQAAQEARKKARLEELKKRIHTSTAKAGLEESTEVQLFEVPDPPEVEFWDQAFQNDMESSDAITNLVVHPVLIEPPQEKFVQIKSSALKLTKLEQKKIRRIRRAEEHREEQAKIRLGLVPTPAPKIKHSNVMRVYGDMAVKDPTAVEAMVNKQVRERRETHLAANAERQLSTEEKAEKAARKARENADMGLHMCVFRIALGKDHLLGKHRYKIDINAKQYKDITGFVLAGPTFTLAIIEGGEHSVKKYKHLMLDRIQWKAILAGNGEVQADADDEDEAEKDNTCSLLWQGQVRDRKFKKWGSIREVELDSQAKEALKRPKLENFWTIARTSTSAV